MPSAASAFALGLLHGPAELLPVSSSAHVALALRALGEPPSKELEVALHAGTLLALGPVRPSAFLAAATIPPAVAGALLERPIERRLGGPRTVAAGLVAGGITMALADRRPETHAKVSSRDGWLFGVAQAAALWPGVSRLGATMTVARALRLGREEARAVSIRAGIPVLAGATALKGARVATERADARPLVAGLLGSFLSTAVLKRRVRPGRLWPFALYRAALAGTVLAVFRDADDRA